MIREGSSLRMIAWALRPCSGYDRAGRINAVDQVRIHDLEVTGGIMAGRIGHHGRMVLGHPRIECRMLRVPVCPCGIAGLPVIILEVRHRECNEHAGVIRGGQRFLEAEMRTGFAVVIVGIDHVDAYALQALDRFFDGGVGSQPRAKRGIVQRLVIPENTRAVEHEVAAFDPEFPETETHRQENVHWLSGAVRAARVPNRTGSSAY